MGGFYDAWLAGCLGFQHLVMINPALQPWQLLKQVTIGSRHLLHITLGNSIGSSISHKPTTTKKSYSSAIGK
ncbi:MAG: hypothetical protein KZQ84_11050 [Candidatus Thiodiazotropha sp. (ex Lucinoma borealis)]|nr:hypothetical protein [Candidatus Thiodiazotropha sp. (ex Lucinoma borealis)]